MRVGVAGTDLHLIGKLDAGERKPHLQRGNGRVAGSLYRAEGAHSGEDCLRDAVEPKRE